MALDNKAAAIVKALAYTENGGKPTITKAGKSGELKSMFQFMPDTWKLYAKQISGDENLPLTNENEAAVVYGKVQQWLQQGYDAKQIASMWNAGEQRPDAWKNLKGVNSRGVNYDTPAYAKKVDSYTKQFEKELGQKGTQSQATPKTIPQLAQTTSVTPTAPLQNQATLPSMLQARQV